MIDSPVSLYKQIEGEGAEGRRGKGVLVEGRLRGEGRARRTEALRTLESGFRCRDATHLKICPKGQRKRDTN